MDFRIISKSLPEALPQLEALDRVAMPEDMWLSEEERDILQAATDGLAVLIMEGENIIAGGYALPAKDVEDFLQEVDSKFAAQDEEAYIYSVAVAPNARRKLLGTILRIRLVFELREKGFKIACSHIKMSNDWHVAGQKTYDPTETRIVSGYWPGSEYPDVEFQRFNL